MRQFVRSVLDVLQMHFSGDLLWVVLLGNGALCSLVAFYSHVYVQLATVRPLLVFVLVNGELPPI